MLVYSRVQILRTRVQDSLTILFLKQFFAKISSRANSKTLKANHRFKCKFQRKAWKAFRSKTLWSSLSDDFILPTCTCLNIEVVYIAPPETEYQRAAYIASELSTMFA
eukprot:GHVU01070565.1.p2 GENE.GHVU01070565.1~~GHVU01070565.1.p2  ORF type:complete len:108 (-),score=6.24 GHVU01070565.1:378-701(-)